MVEYEIRVVSAPDRKRVKVLGATFEPDKSKEATLGSWRPKLRSRSEMLLYLKHNERYLYGQSSAYGSEKRQHPA
jgi:hypothetical protein